MVNAGLVALCLLALADGAIMEAPQDNVDVFFSIDAKGKVEVNDVVVRKGFAEPPPSINPSYPDFVTVEVVAGAKTLFSTKIIPEFFVNTLPPTPRDKSEHRISYRRFGDDHELIVRSKSINFRYAIHLCNHDDRCDRDESLVSCSDCPAWANDGVCGSPSGDGQCDPDCLAGIDTDCPIKAKPTRSFFAKIYRLLLIYVILRAVATLVTIWAIWRRRVARWRWTLIVTIFGFLGIIGYWLFGRGTKRIRPPLPPTVRGTPLPPPPPRG